MSSGAGVSRYCFSCQVHHRSTLVSRCSTKLFRDSRELVVHRLTPELSEHAEPMQGQGFFEALGEDGFRARLVIPAAQAEGHLAEQAGIELSGGLEGLVGERDLLVAEENQPLLAVPPGHTWVSAGPVALGPASRVISAASSSYTSSNRG